MSWEIDKNLNKDKKKTRGGKSGGEIITTATVSTNFTNQTSLQKIYNLLSFRYDVILLNAPIFSGGIRIGRFIQFIGAPAYLDTHRAVRTDINLTHKPSLQESAHSTAHVETTLSNN